MLGAVFGKKNELKLKTDLHNHLLPNVDDGVRSLEESKAILEHLERLGYEKVIITPHIYPEVFPNSEKELTSDFKVFMSQLDTGLDLHLAAEYYSDESLLKKVKSGKDLLTFGDNHVLIETSFFTKSILLEEVIFQLSAHGYKPVLAHPERYFFAHDEPEFYRNLKRKDVLFQMNAGSIEGTYGREVKKAAEFLLKNDMIDVLGSDIHRMDQARTLGKALKNKLVNKMDPDRFLNNKL